MRRAKYRPVFPLAAFVLAATTAAHAAQVIVHLPEEATIRVTDATPPRRPAHRLPAGL